VRIVVDDLSGPEVAALLDEHLEEMRAVSPPESKHALDLEDLRRSTSNHFAPARRLYARHGFVPCAPFGDYPDDPHSAHLTLVL
jgi:hypothetical protein